MIALEDCIALCGLTEEEVLAVAEHERLPLILAASLGSSLLSQDRGTEKVRDMIVEDIEQAQRRGNREHASALSRVLRGFLQAHPEAGPCKGPWIALFQN